jgi:hypothetical protein
MQFDMDDVEGNKASDGAMEGDKPPPAATKPRRKPGGSDLWKDWTEGGIRDRTGRTRQVVSTHFGSKMS